MTLPKLTPRLQQVAELRRAGAKYKEIASILNIGVETVKSHSKIVREIYRAHQYDEHLNAKVGRAERLQMLKQIALKAIGGQDG
jgi:DNA-binding NarL/FixJ family response regulator